MITRELLLHNGFYEQNVEGAEFKYTKYVGDAVITVGYNLYGWYYEIKNNTYSAAADCFGVIYIDYLQTLISLGCIDFILERPDGKPFSDFHRSVDFAVLFDFGDNDYSISMAAAAEFYCDAFNDLLTKIDSYDNINKSNDMKDSYIDDFNKLCEVEAVKEIMKCGLLSDKIKSYSTDFGDKLPNVNEILGRSMKSLDYIFGNDKKKRWGKVEGKYVVTEEMDRFCTGTYEEILSRLSKHGEPYENVTADDIFPVWCNSEIVILYMKDGFLTYTIR